LVDESSADCRVIIGACACAEFDMPAIALILLFLSPWLTGAALAERVQVAVAANFASTFQAIERDFEAATGHEVVAIVGSTGKLQAQVRAGAPFEVLLAADDETPRKLIDDGLAVAGSSFTYAIGKLALWSARPGQAIVDQFAEIGRAHV